MDIFVGNKRNQDGSCLVELLVVLFIIVVLLSIGSPMYFVIVRRTEAVVCGTHSLHLNKLSYLDPHLSPEKALGEYLNQNEQYQCPSGGFYIYSGNRVGCSIHDDIEDHVVCTFIRKSLGEDYHRYLESVPEYHPIMTWTEFLGDHQNICPSSGVITYSSGTVVCSVHHGSNGDGDNGSVPFL